ncbi:MAG TPA: DUF2141 domain-containing protein [Alphaproteobacteria bacterium]|nr:DUF2141 domain-containing protein [Alphaproteobacteria bacterium]
MIQKFSIGVLLAFLLASPTQAAELRLTIYGVHSNDGELLIGLYENSAGFLGAISRASKSGLMPDSGRLVGVSIRAKAGTQSTVFTQLPPGQYAAIVIHDENDNGRLDSNGFGVPSEGYGFSRDARGFLSAPSFAAAAIAVGDSDVSTTVELIYPIGSSDEETSDYKRYLGAVPETGR